MNEAKAVQVRLAGSSWDGNFDDFQEFGQDMASDQLTNALGCLSDRSKRDFLNLNGRLCDVEVKHYGRNIRKQKLPTLNTLFSPLIQAIFHIIPQFSAK